MKLHIYSPELDATLIKSLQNFIYPKDFEGFEEIVVALSQKGVYEDENCFIELYIGDAREYLLGFEEKFDIVYQDAFSPSANPLLWTKEYFQLLAKTMKEDAILTTYSIALKIRLGLYENSFNLYLNQGEGYRDATVASKCKDLKLTKVDMQHKISCNPLVKPLSDEDLTEN